MTTVFDVPADLLIKKVAEEFKENDKINSPATFSINKSAGTSNTVVILILQYFL